MKVFHGLSNELPKGIHKSKIPSLVTIHDLIFVRYPQFYKTLDRAIYSRKTKYACSAAASLYCGTGGCMLNLIVDGAVRAWQATGWRLIDWGPDRILLIGRDGGWCGGAGAEVCYEALVWSNGRVLTVGPAPEQ